MERLPYIQNDRERKTFLEVAVNAAFRSNQEWDERFGHGPIAAGLDYNILGRLNAMSWSQKLELTPEEIYTRLSNAASNQKTRWVKQLTFAKSHEEYLNDRFYQNN